jgi:hypothetical protein
VSIWVKDPDDERWFEFDWSAFLATGETITAHTTTVDTAMTKVSDTANATSVSVQVSGGTAGTKSVITCLVNTSAGNIYETQKWVSIYTRQS